MIIPIGHERSSTRRWPWVSLTMAVICIVAFFLSSMAESRIERLEEEASEKAYQYWMEHPYLDLDKELVFGTMAPMIEEYMQEAVEEFEAYRDELAAQADKPDGYDYKGFGEYFEGGEDKELVWNDPAKKSEVQQQELDRLIEEWREVRDRHPTMQWGLVPAKASFLTIVSSIFMHSGWMHILGNLLFFWVTGPALEDVWGRPVFLVLFLLGGVVANCFWIARYPESLTPLVGASGAIAALMGAFMVRYWSLRIRFFYFIFFRAGTFWAPAWVWLGLWFLGELFWSNTWVEKFGGVAYWVHVSGFGFGVLFAGAIRWFSIEDRVLKPKIEAILGDETNYAIEKAHDLRQAGQTEEAWRVLSDEIRERPSNQDAVLALWDLSMQLGREPQVAKLFLKVIRNELRQGELLLGLTHWEELCGRIPETPMDLDLRIRLGDALLETERDEEAADLMAGVEPVSQGRPLPVPVLTRAARTAAISRSASSIALCEALLERPGLPEGIVREIDGLLLDVREMGVREPPQAPPPDDAPLPFTPQEEVLPQMIERSSAPAAVAAVAAPAAFAAASPVPRAPAPPAVRPPPVPAAPPPAVPRLVPPRPVSGPPPLPTPAAAAPPVAAVPASAAGTLQVMASVPKALTAEKITIDLAGQGTKIMPLDRVKAISAAVVGRPAPGKPYVVLDLLVDPPGQPTVRTIRLQSFEFDARKFVPREPDALKALVAVINHLLKVTRARALPNPKAVCGQPFPRFPSLGEYEARILGARSGPG